jgi:hypothetical protein
MEGLGVAAQSRRDVLNGNEDEIGIGLMAYRQ